MTRDYKDITEAKLTANVKKTKTRKAKKQKPTKKKINEEPVVVKSSQELPGWVWLASGLLIGGFVSFIIYLKTAVPEQATAAKKGTTDVEQVQSNSKEKQSTKDDFEYYTVLPNRQVTLPNDEISNFDSGAHIKDSSALQNQKNPSENKQVEQASNKQNNINVNAKPRPAAVSSYLYTLQAGSFRNFKDADRQKASIAMLGQESKIHVAKTNHQTHYRVLLGPYVDIKRINQIDAVLKRNKIKTLLLKVKG